MNKQFEKHNTSLLWDILKSSIKLKAKPKINQIFHFESIPLRYKPNNYNKLIFPSKHTIYEIISHLMLIVIPLIYPITINYLRAESRSVRLLIMQGQARDGFHKRLLFRVSEICFSWVNGEFPRNE